MRYWNLTLLTIKKVAQLERVRYMSVDMSAKRIAVCQMTSIADKAANLQVVSQLISDAAKEKVQMVFFPEACDYLCDNKKDTVNQAEPILTGNIVKNYRQMAAQHKVWLSMGGVHEKDEKDPTKMYNTHVIINSAGDVVQTYRKLHLFDVEIPEKNVRLKESDFSRSGAHIVSPVDTPAGKIGMAICYDMRFPELSTTLSILSAEILTYPSAFTQATGAAHWHTLLRARAIENQCYVVAAAQVGAHNPKRKSYGHAVIIDPWGEVLADCGDSAPAIRVADVSEARLTEVRRNMPVFQHRRRDVYSLHALSLRKDVLPEHDPHRSALAETRTDDPVDDGPSHVFGHVRVPDACVFYKSKLTYAFVNLRCVIPGHVLVAPLREAERNQDLTDEEAEDFFRTIRLVQKLMERVHKTESCTVTIQDGPDAGQTVKHLHCHIMPRRKGDFIHSALIYLELARHDQFKTGPKTKPPRTKQEMCDEASFLRSEIATMIVQKGKRHETISLKLENGWTDLADFGFELFVEVQGRYQKHLHCHIMPRKKGDFIENDLIYLELAKHDQFKQNYPAKPARTRKEMEAEAALLRTEIVTLLTPEGLHS